MFTWLWPARIRSTDQSLGITARLRLAVVGTVPVSLVGLSTIGWWQLRTLALVVLVPALAVTAPVVVRHRAARHLVAWAIVWGVTATLIYDLFRWGFLLVGLVGRDPFPHLGSGLGLEPGWAFGYLWRYIGNGAGLAVVFLALGGRGPRAGLGHGLLICSPLHRGRLPGAVHDHRGQRGTRQPTAGGRHLRRAVVDCGR